MILYRSVGLQELELIYDSGMKAFPGRLPQQPIFYPVLELAYARQTASDWNTNRGEFAGYITQFKVEDDYIGHFEEHAVGETPYQEFWIPAEEMEEFNRHILGHIKVLEAHFGEGFQGFVPKMFGLQGKNAVEQFTLLANSYLYKRMDFFLEIKRNHKAVFLNYPFWQTHEFKNKGLKEKIIQAIKEAWLTSFPQIPLPPPVQEDTPLVKKTNSDSLVDPVEEDEAPEEEVEFHSPAHPLGEETSPGEQTHPNILAEHAPEYVTPKKGIDARSSAHPVRESVAPRAQSGPHFVQGIKLGVEGKVREAIGELSRVVEIDPEHVVARTSLGVAFHRLGEDDRALASYESALRIDPIHAEAHYFRANIRYSRGATREAITGYTVAIGLQPELIEAHQNPIPQDRLTDYTGTPAEMHWIAKSAHRILGLNRSLESNPRQVHLLKERAAEYRRLWNYSQAIADYSSSLAIQPDDAGAFHSRGVAYEQLGQQDRAQEDYQRAVAIDPHLPDMYINRGVSLGKAGNFRQSIVSLTESIRLAPRNPDGHFNRGFSYVQLGEYEKAIADFSKVLQLSSNDEDACYWRGVAYEAMGRLDEATADYRQFLEITQNPSAREEIEQRLRQWRDEKQNDAGNRGAFPDDRQKTSKVPSEKPEQGPDLYELIVALGDRALDSIWLGSGVNCTGEKAEELYSFTDQNRPIQGHDLLPITSGIHQTTDGDFQAFDPGADSYWVFIRAWEGSGFYIETNDPKVWKRLKSDFQSIEEVEGAPPPYVGLFLRI